MKTIYVRIGLKNGQESFFRCAMQFSRQWRKVEVDEATATRLETEQMLEVSVTEPEDYEEGVTAGDSAAANSVTGASSGTPAVAPGNTPPVAPEDPAERLAAIRAAIGQLDKEDAALWTAGGKAKTESIAAVTGWPVSAAERDAAMAEGEAQ